MTNEQQRRAFSPAFAALKGPRDILRFERQWRLYG
jgi:hypothetical protein